MMFCKNFVASVSHNGKFLRENNEQEVHIPFSSEYSIFLKNLSGTRAVVSVSIDGKDALDGNRIVIDPNKEMELLGFMKKSKVTNKFKFIEKTAEISEHRGDRIDDGIIRIEYQFENPVVYGGQTTYYNPPFYKYTTIGGDWFGTQNVNYTSDSLVGSKITASTYTAQVEEPNDGITVKGSKTSQDFSNTYIWNLNPNKEVITLKLIGMKDSGVKIETPVYTREKIECETCGRLNKTHNKFCGNCGTSLI